MTASLFVTCIVDQLFPQIGLSAVKVLRKLGVEVEFNPRQTCCGQPAFNSGYRDEARRVAGRFLEVFQDSEYVVAPSGSCAAMIKIGIPQLFPAGAPELARAERVASRTWEFSDFLVSVLKAESTGAEFPHKVVYHDSCHLLRELGVSRPPRQLLRAVRGIQLLEMSFSDRCCGFGGTFSVKFPEVSASMAEDKAAAIVESGAEYVVACDASCLMQIDGVLRRKGIPVRTIHLAEVLACNL